MTNVTVADFRRRIFEYVDRVIRFNGAVNVATENGNAVLISEEEYNGMVETLRLMRIPGMVEEIREARCAPDDEFTPLDEIEWE